MRTIACLHAHHSNITYIDQLLEKYDVKILHYVDSDLINQLSDPDFPQIEVKVKLEEHINQIMSTEVDGLILTCTNFIGLLDRFKLDFPFPILKIDEAFFEEIIKLENPRIFFTNPQTIDVTLARLKQFSEANHYPFESIQIKLVEDSFPLILNNQKQEYLLKIKDCIDQHLEQNEHVCLGQLSMSDVHRLLSSEQRKLTITMLEPLLVNCIEKFSLKKKIGT
ncbi:hypothetical protein BTS2_3456 [Bacillus sp. TS-2]|nr:hypothetical protein BTS2_3456 [Bacillus sp. TS-2]